MEPGAKLMKKGAGFVFILIFLLVSCREKAELPYNESRFLMDTVVRIGIYQSDFPLDKIKATVDGAFDTMARLEGKLSSGIDTSEVSRLNQTPQTVSKETWDCLADGIRLSKLCGGAFDITIGEVKQLWDFSGDNPKVPDPAELREALAYVDYHQVLLDSPYVSLRFPENRIDLGGIVKGFIVDQAVMFLEKSGIKAGVVEAGGDLRFFGHHPQKDKWRVGVQNPRPKDKQITAIIALDSGAVATSGDYERFFMRDGKRYHHLLDPKTGYPASECISVTIVTTNAMLADGLATAVFVLGPIQGMTLVEKMDDVEVVIISESNGKMTEYVSRGLKGNIQFL